ncbi:MAG: hypothetical protein QG657_4881 [Acidobacteriota bacterium]|nr:hypothetical protein [Acidobacteriota bacterium]
MPKVQGKMDKSFWRVQGTFFQKGSLVVQKILFFLLEPEIEKDQRAPKVQRRNRPSGHK